MRAVVRVQRGVLGFLLVLALVAAAPPVQDPATPVSPWRFEASLRNRYEHVEWFGSEPQDRKYDFGHSKLRFGVGYAAEPYSLFAEGQYFQMYALPENGAGPGGAYRTANAGQSHPGAVALRQLYVARRGSDVDAIAGRFLYSNGSEAMPRQKQLAAVRSSRIAQRVIGPFDFTAGRSFDGARATFGTDIGAFSALYVMPTQGGFEVNLNRTITDVQVGALSWTAPMFVREDASDDVQVFAYLYTDDREAVKIDNRPLADRTADVEDLQLQTFGAHWTRVWGSKEFEIDSLLWGVIQSGDWGAQDHEAWAYTAEIGVRAVALSGKPGLRIGYTVGSGDGNPEDGTHKTFFQMLPTARAYAATPFYNMQNLEDLFVQASVNVHEAVSIRPSVHRLRLAESADGLYSGAGANERKSRFGYASLSGSGSADVGTLLDLEATWVVNKNLSATIYYGHLFGGDMIEGAAPAQQDIDYFFTELTLKL